MMNGSATNRPAEHADLHHQHEAFGRRRVHELACPSGSICYSGSMMNGWMRLDEDEARRRSRRRGRRPRRSAVSGARRGAPGTTSFRRRRRGRRQVADVIVVRIARGRRGGGNGTRAMRGLRRGLALPVCGMPCSSCSTCSKSGGAAGGGSQAACWRSVDRCSSTRISSSSVCFSSFDARLNSFEAASQRTAQLRQLSRPEDDQRDHHDDDQLGHADGTKHNGNP